MNPLDITELLTHVISFTDNQTFAACARVNREWNAITRELTPQKKVEFLQTRNFTDEKGLDHEVKTFPNGTRHGEEKILKSGQVLSVRQWKEGKLDGFELKKQPFEEAIPWKEGSRDGMAVAKCDDNVRLTRWFHNRREYSRIYDSNGNILRDETWTSKKGSVRKIFSNNKVVDTEYRINGRKHGVHDGELYLHGFYQPWYVETWTEIGCVVFITLLFLGFIIATVAYSIRVLYFAIIMGVTILYLWGPLFAALAISLTSPSHD